MRILSVTNEASGCGEYRTRIPLAELAARGHEIDLPPLGGAALPTTEALTEADVIVGLRLGGSNTATMLTWWKAFAPFVYDIDDDPFHLDVTNPALAPYMHPDIEMNTRACIERADLVTVSTPYLGALIEERYNANTAVLGNCIDAALLDVPRPVRAPGAPVVFGWTASTSHQPDFDQVRDVWRAFFTERPDAARFHLFGCDYQPTWDHDYTKWLRPDAYYRAIARVDVGLAPLLPTRFSRAKSHLKALEFAALGIPTIAADLEPYRDFVIDGATGYLVSSPEQWRDRLDALAHDDDMRREMGSRARERAARWTIQHRWPLWVDAYTRAGVLAASRPE